MTVQMSDQEMNNIINEVVQPSPPPAKPEPEPNVAPAQNVNSGSPNSGNQLDVNQLAQKVNKLTSDFDYYKTETQKEAYRAKPTIPSNPANNNRFSSDVNIITPKTPTESKTWDGTGSGIIDLARDQGMDTTNKYFRSPLVLHGLKENENPLVIDDQELVASIWMNVKRLDHEYKGEKEEVEKLDGLSTVYHSLYMSEKPGSIAVKNVATRKIVKTLDLINTVYPKIDIQTYGEGDQISWINELTLPEIKPFKEKGSIPRTEVDFEEDTMKREYQGGRLAYSQWFKDVSLFSPIPIILNWLLRGLDRAIMRQMAVGDPASGELCGLLNTPVEANKILTLNAALGTDNIMLAEEELFSQFDDDGLGQVLEQRMEFYGPPSFLRACKKFAKLNKDQTYITSRYNSQGINRYYYSEIPIESSFFMPKNDDVLNGVVMFWDPSKYQIAIYEDLNMYIDSSGNLKSELMTEIAIFLKMFGRYLSKKHIGKIIKIKNLK